jgi:hypothetical protein
MKRSTVTAIVFCLLAVALSAPESASAAWTKPGKCRVPESQKEGFGDLANRRNNRFSTRTVPCYIAAYAIKAMLRDGRWAGDSFRFTARGARWYLKLACRGRVRPRKPGVPQPGRVIFCRVREGEDAKTKRGTTRNLAGGSIRWVTAYTG